MFDQVYDPQADAVVVLFVAGVIVRFNCCVTQFVVVPVYVPLAVYVVLLFDQVYDPQADAVVVLVVAGVIVRFNCCVTQFVVVPVYVPLAV